MPEILTTAILTLLLSILGFFTVLVNNKINELKKQGQTADEADTVSAAILEHVISKSNFTPVIVDCDRFSKALASLENGTDFEEVVLLLIDIFMGLSPDQETRVVDLLQKEIYSNAYPFVTNNKRFIKELILGLSAPQFV